MNVFSHKNNNRSRDFSSPFKLFDYPGVDCSGITFDILNNALIVLCGCVRASRSASGFEPAPIRSTKLDVVRLTGESINGTVDLAVRLRRH